MANNLGDFDTSAVIYGKFTSVRVDTGAPATLAGSPVLSVYKDNSLTQKVEASALGVDWDGVTGLNNFTIDTSADTTFYSAGSFFDIIISTGTVNSVSAVGYCVGQFTIRKASVLRPTVAARTLDVTATGEAGIDWANVGGQSASVALSSTDISLVDFVGTVGSIAAGGIDNVSMGTDAISASALSIAAVNEIAAAIVVPTAIANADALLDRANAIEVGLTPRQSLRLALAALAGKVSGGGTVTNTFRNPVADSKNRIIATVDATGNRSAVTYDVT